MISILCAVLLSAPASKEIRFPFKLTPETKREDLADRIDLCLDPNDADGTVNCELKQSEDYSVTLGEFSANIVRVSFVKNGNDYSLMEVGVMMNVEDCEDMARAYAAATAFAKQRYESKGTKTITGPRFGSSLCRDYMKEGQVAYLLSAKDWTVRVDSYYHDGNFMVYLLVINNARKSLSTETAAASRAKSAEKF